MSARVLVVEDDPTMAGVLIAYLRRAGYECERCTDGGEALERWARTRPDVVILDIMLPTLSGLEVLRRRRRAGDDTAVIVLSARGEEEDRLVGLETGADDYVVKPFSPREVVLRVEALLRRAERLTGARLLTEDLTLGDLRIDLAARRATRRGTVLALTTREFDLLAFLVGHTGQTFGKADLLRRVWGWEFGDTSTVTVHVRRLREKLEDDPSDPRLVLTVGRSGYRMARPDELVDELASETAEELEGMTDLLIVAGLSVLACGIVGALGAVFFRRRRGASLRTLVALAAVLPVLAVAASVVVNVRLMFLSPHDTTVVLIALGVALVLALVGGLLITRTIGAASRQLRHGVDLLVADATSGTRPEVSPEVLPAELARVSDELAEARRTLAAARARERAAEQARRELVSFMSHDLRTPLAGLRALTEGLEDGVISDVRPAYVQMRSTVARMTTMVDDLFALSRVYDGPPEQPLSLVSLTELVHDVVGEAEPAADAAGVRLGATVPDDDPLAVLGRYDDLHRALANLVSNAIRHTGNQPAVAVHANRAEDGSIRVAVADGCGGIPDDHLPRVFDTGWRGSPERGGSGGSVGSGGAGLGLAIARGVVESHRGEIAVHNTDVGCRFELALPSPEVS